MVDLLVVFIGAYVTLLGFFLWVLRDMRRGLREMQQLTVEALLDKVQ